MGECRDNIYAGSIFNWMSVDATRNRLMEVSGGSAIGVQGAPVEVSLWTNGIYAGQYEDKYKYSADFGVQACLGLEQRRHRREKCRPVEHLGQRGILQRRPDETRTDGAYRHDDFEHDQRRPLRHGHRRQLGQPAKSGRRFTARISFTATTSPTPSPAPTQPAQALYTDALAQAAAETTRLALLLVHQCQLCPGRRTAARSPDKLSSPTAAIPTPPPPTCGSASVQQPATTTGDL